MNLCSFINVGNITRKLDKAPKKDTVIIPDGGFTIIRFLTDNPGWWFFHCHLEFHVEVIIPFVFYESINIFKQCT